MAPVEYFPHKGIIFICPFLRVFRAFHSSQSFIYHLFYCPLHVCARLFLSSSSSFSFMSFFCSMCFGVSNWTLICFYQQAKQNLGPGEYDLKSFLHELNGSYLTLFSSWNFLFSYILIFYTVSRLFSFFLCFVRQAQKPPWSIPQSGTFPGLSHQQGLLFHVESISQGSGKCAV